LTQDYKEFIDAENLMPLGTSDLRTSVLLEMRPFSSSNANTPATTARAAMSTTAIVTSTAARDLAGSVDSSDTYASCSTHPFASQIDLSQGENNAGLYVNPFTSPGSPPMLRPPVKSASGDGNLLRGLTPEAMDYEDEEEINDDYFYGDKNNYRYNNQGINSGSRGSLNNSTSALPKHRKTRFQQVRQFLI
jgi:hypothetical protein